MRYIIRLLIDNRYLYQQFWGLQNGIVSEENWLGVFDNAKKAANRVLGKQDTNKVLALRLSCCAY